ncbi:MAG: class I SAM-dependent methyltransferase [Alphaproteobacteria bacterium]|nr:class I SAM-dependent methyltransferase [Alphaproteobacteria bacterium]
MTSTPVSEIGDKYVLPTGTDDAARLDVIHAVYGPVSIRGLEAAAVSTAARVADIGCGTGTVSRWMAARMGASGRVDAIDIAPEQIEVARAAPVNAGSAAIHYQVGSAYEPGLPENAFDVVFCRLVLCHLKEPQKAVVQMAKLLKPGGRLVLVDMDLRDIFTIPPCAFYQAYVDEVVTPYQAKINVDYSVGLRLPQLIAAAGLRIDSLVSDQPLFRDGPEKHLWEKTWTFALQRAAPEGVVTMERGMQLIAGMQQHTANPDVWVAVAKMFAAVGVRSPR